MGNCSSIKAETLERAKNDMMALPSYCAAYQSETGPVDDATAKIVVETWHLCMAGTAEPFIEAHRITPSLTPLVFFYNTVCQPYHYIGVHAFIRERIIDRSPWYAQYSTMIDSSPCRLKFAHCSSVRWYRKVVC